MAAGTLSASAVLSTEIKTKDTWCAMLADYPQGEIPNTIQSHDKVITLEVPVDREVEIADDIRWIILQSLPRH
jgi:hypothetical protein